MRHLAIATLLFTAFVSVHGQITPEMRQEANGFYQAQEWEKAAADYQKIVTAEETNANARYRLGNSLLNLNKNAEALTHLEKVFTAAPNPVFALTLARGYARMGNKDKALETLEKTLKMGGIQPDQLTSEKDFASWRDDAAFKDLVRRSDMAVNPCKAAPEFRQFDFWIGEWDVKTPQGGPAGSSSIQLILGQCTILENWTASAGGQGKSFNIFDKTDNKWHQTWVSDRGVFTHYVGGLVGNDMVLTAETLQAGKRSLQRMTFSKLANGNVRQHGEASNDDGKTWSSTFDLTYSRKAK
jgi:tetratricopeptide (TPR) repeat protein